MLISDIRLGDLFHIPISIIRRLRDEVESSKVDSLVLVKITQNYPSSNSCRFRVEGYKNSSSIYGDYYAKKKDLVDYLNKVGEERVSVSSNISETTKQENVKYIIIKYVGRNGLTKVLKESIDCSIGDFLVLESKSAKYAIAEVVGKIELQDDILTEYYFEIFDRKIVCKVD